MMRVAVRIFHPPAPDADAPLASWLHRARATLAQRQASAFAASGARDIRIVSNGESVPFGERLRDLVPELGGFDGLVVLGSGAIPLATPADRQRFVQAAAGRAGSALANNRFSADIVAIAGLAALARLPDLSTDNALPRWLAEVAGYAVTDLRRTWRLGIDVDAPLDVLLLGARGRACRPTFDPPTGVDITRVLDRMTAVARLSRDVSAELIIAGRTSALTLAWLERTTRGRIRAIVEERGLKTGDQDGRAPASLLGALLDREGPQALGTILGRLGEAAFIDTRVLLAHRLGRDERRWPGAEDRFASDLLLPDRIRDPWLRALTAAAADAPIPVLLGGHTLVGPGLHLVLGATSAAEPAPGSGR